MRIPKHSNKLHQIMRIPRHRMMVIDLQQPAALSVIVERKLLPAARQNRIAQPVQVQSGDVDNIVDQRVAVGVLQLVDGAGCRGALV